MSRRKEERVLRQRSDSTREIDIFAEARKVIGLFPTKSRHILDFHQGKYTPSLDDDPKLNKERFLAAKDFLKKELTW